LKIFFFGATRSVSGSLHEVEAGGKNWLFDCGLFQGRRQDMYECNAKLPVSPGKVAGVFLSHAHVDHSGRLPRLVSQGFRGPIYATRPTIDLCELLLEDSAYVLRSQTKKLNARRKARGLTALPELYNEEDVNLALSLMREVEWGEDIIPSEGLKVNFLSAGHILGASIIVLTETKRKETCRIAFSGDIGRPGDWILPQPDVPENADYLVLESTYGDRIHRPYSYAKSEFCNKINETIESGGKIIIPAFSVGRTQRLLYELHEFINSGALPDVPIYLDSPLSIKASENFLRHSDILNERIEDTIDSEWHKCTPVVSPDESKELVKKDGPYIVITASGMCEAGRVLYHLQSNLPDENSRVVFVGFCAKDTLGRQLIDGIKTVRINKVEVPVNANIDFLDTFSSHADKENLINWVKAQNEAKGVFLVHGEEEQTFALAEELENETDKEIVVPFSGESFELTKEKII